MYYHLEHWHWWVLTLIFLVTAALWRGPIHLSLTFSTIVVGFVVWSDPIIPAKIQLLLFTLITGIGILFSQFFGKSQREKGSKADSDENFVDQLNADDDNIVGRTFILETAIENGAGSISFDNQQWKLRGEDAAAGTTIRIEGVDGIDKTFLEVSIVK
ncbi:MAG: NfeD family protein [Thiohalomonadales bacterium]